MTARPTIRHYDARDRAQLYDVCVRTGDSGQDATGLYEEPALLGDVFVGAYVDLQPEYSFVLDGDSGAEGYVLGALDTAAFAVLCEEQWWPGLRAVYADAIADPPSRDAWLLKWIETPPPVPDFALRYPSHVHIDLLPRWQGGGWGRRLITTVWMALQEAGSVGVHLGVGATNEHAVGFYRHLGMTELEREESTIWMGLDLTAWTGDECFT